MSIGGKIVLGVVIVGAAFGAYKWFTRDKEVRNPHPLGSGVKPVASVNINNIPPVSASTVPRSRG